MLERLRFHCSGHVSLACARFLFSFLGLTSFFLFAGALNRFASKLKHFKIYTHNCQKMFKFVYQRSHPPPSTTSTSSPAAVTLPLPFPVLCPTSNYTCICNRKALPAFNLNFAHKKGTKGTLYIYIYICIWPHIYIYVRICTYIAAYVHLDIILAALSRGCCV